MAAYLPPEALSGMSLDQLQEQYDLFIAETGLPKMSADELLAEIAGTGRTKEYRWLDSFYHAWMGSESSERAARRAARAEPQ